MEECSAEHKETRFKMAKYPKMLSNYNATVGDFTVTDHQALPSVTEFQTIATYKCPAQQSIAVGYGVANVPDSCGFLYIFLANGVDAAPVEVTGKVRIIATNYAGTKITFIGEWDESICHGSLTDRRLKLPLPESRVKIGQDSYIKIQVMPLVAHVAAGANADNLGWSPNTAQQSEIHIPITVFDNS
jgi:hypothetical protein